MKHVNNKGFSLIELMIVVAIIGILATVAIPNFQRFQMKAKQSEVKNNLSGYYMAATAFQAEFNGYAGDFVAYGFNPTGIVNYRYVALAYAVAGYAGVGTPACISTSAGCPTTANSANNGQWVLGWTESPIVKTPATAATSTQNAFTFTAASTLGVAANTDEWTITNTNLVTNVTPGL